MTSIKFKGKSGKEYDCDIYPIDQEFNDVSAVYIFTKLYSPNGNSYSHSVIYIGESSELGQRIANHEKWPVVNRNGANRICVHCVDGQKNRLDVETDLRHAFPSAPGNDQ